MSLKRMINGQVIDIAGSGGGGAAAGAITSETLENGKIWTGTLAEFNLIVPKDENTLYNITDDSTETLDNVPTQGSSNGVESGGVYAAINAKGNVSALNDVVLTSPSAGQVLKYNSTLQKWVNSADEVSGLSDVTITSLTDGQVLKYDSATGKWVNGEGGGGGNTFIQPIVFDSGFNGQTLTITKSGGTSSTVTLDSTGQVTIFLTEAGTYTYSCTATYGYTFTHEVTYTYFRQYDTFRIMGKAPMYAFESATDDQLADMLWSYYGGAYDAADIATLKATYFPIGAKRTIHLSQMAAGNGVSETHFDALGADYQFTILDHEHDTLTTPSSGGKTKAFITVQQDRILYKNTIDSTYSSSYPATTDGGGYMNATNTTTGGWKESTRRAWCNDTYFNALPSDIRSLVQSVSKQTTNGGTSTTIEVVQDNVFLLSEWEIFGATSYSKGGNGEGTQYEYYKTAANRYKKPSYTSYASADWWERSVYNASQFCHVHRNGSANYNDASNARGLAPAFCI